MELVAASPYGDVQQWCDQAVQAYNASQWNTALACVARVLSIDPEHADALHLRGLLELALNETPAAEKWIVRAIQARPDPTFYNSLCVTQTRLRAFSRAAESARQGLVLARQVSPSFDIAALLYNLGLALQLNGSLEDAADQYRNVIAIHPGHSEAHNNLSTILNTLGALEPAILHLYQAIALKSDNLEARSNLGHALLTAGRYEEAWPHYEHRWASFKDAEGNQGVPPPALPLPQWQGQEVSVGKHRLLVLHEQGFGDTLQFSRYLPMALARFAVVGFVCPRPLRRLLEYSFCSRWPHLVLLDEPPADWHDWDWYASLLSLPMAFATCLSNIPAALPYLHADTRLSETWRARLARLGPPELPRVGVVWAGGHSGLASDRQRSIAPEQLAPLFAWPHVRWISLQKTDDPAKQLPLDQQSKLVDWMSEVDDFADTAALIEHLDLVISVDTSVAHLAAAIGKRVWLLNRFAGCWRWLRNRDDSLWYPGMRLFTQTQRGDWSDVLTRVAAALERFNSG